ncbi:hypothetical protein M0811_08498 [Anaeramoeba ignava]|uniref:Uncharacterized protein n=1 Tax=Anaeramoeba ignava TaxID=1746090 RepID=A0A9Q0RB10_ANAIG|nr:hypothetical protein M0811_08498 [Anaeramoeba ignava]
MEKINEDQIIKLKETFLQFSEICRKTFKKKKNEQILLINEVILLNNLIKDSIQKILNTSPNLQSIIKENENENNKITFQILLSKFIQEFEELKAFKKSKED